MTESAPSGAELPNYDTDRDSAEGLLLTRTSGFAGAPASAHQHWVAALGPTELPSQVQVRVSATLQGYERGSGELEFVIQRCSADLGTCEMLGSATKGFNIGGSGGFKTVGTNVSLSGDLTATMPTLVFTVVALDSSERDLWLAYDTDDHDARIRF